MAKTLFELLSGYSNLHSTRYITNALVHSTRMELPGIGEFLDARMRPYTSRDIDIISKGIQSKRIAYTDEYNNYGPYGSY